MKNVIRDMVAGANLKENYGYTTQEVPNRLRQRQFAEAEAQVGVTQKQLAAVTEQIVQTQTQLTEREQVLTKQQTALGRARGKRRREQHARQRAGQTLRRVEQQLAGLDRPEDQLTERRTRLTARTQHGPLAKLMTRQAELTLKLTERLATRAVIDLTQPMPAPSACWTRVFERELEKDQIMSNFQAVLLNAHQWCGAHYFSGEWSQLELETASARIYRQRGHVAYAARQVTVTLAAFANRAEQDLAEAACHKFDAAHVRDAAGRLIVMGVAPFVHCVRHL